MNCREGLLRRFRPPSAREWPRLAATVGWLLGPGRLGIVRAAQKGDHRRRHDLERRWAAQARWLLGIDLEVIGGDNLRDQYVIAPLHESFADAIALLHLPLGLSFVGRDELAGWPVLGRYLRSPAAMTIEPERPFDAGRTLLRQVPPVFARGDSLVVFPQGTILGIESAFTAGAFRIAERFDKPVLPVVLTGGHRVWEHPFSPTVRFGQRMRLEVLSPVPPAEAMDRLDDVESDMKRRALTSPVPPRRYVPERDGWWDEYRFTIDPSFPELRDRVAKRRRPRDPGLRPERTSD